MTLQDITWSVPAAHIVHEAAGYKLSCLHLLFSSLIGIFIFFSEIKSDSVT